MSGVIQAKTSADRTVVEEIYSTANALHQTAATLSAGEELVGDRWLSQVRITEDWNSFWIAGTVTTEFLVAAEPCRFGSIHIMSGSATGTVTLRDAAATGGGSTGYLFANDTAARLVKGMRFVNGLTVQLSTGTGANGFLILYREAEFQS